MVNLFFYFEKTLPEMIHFDKNGYLIPYEIIEISLADFEQFFVTGLPELEQRRTIFEVYLQYLSELFETVGTEFFQFLNGSFTTTKELPKDIDIVSFVDYRIYRAKRKEIDLLSIKWDQKNEIDPFIVSLSYPGHPRFIQDQLSFDYWQDLFSHGRIDESGVFPEKGLIKIKFKK